MLPSALTSEMAVQLAKHSVCTWANGATFWRHQLPLRSTWGTSINGVTSVTRECWSTTVCDASMHSNENIKHHRDMIYIYNTYIHEPGTNGVWITRQWTSSTWGIERSCWPSIEICTRRTLCNVNVDGRETTLACLLTASTLMSWASLSIYETPTHTCRTYI